MTEAVQANTVKEEVIQMIRRLPDDVTLEDIQYHLFVRAKVEKVLDKVDDGTGLSTEEVKQRTAEWLKPFGNPKP